MRRLHRQLRRSLPVFGLAATLAACSDDPKPMETVGVSVGSEAVRSCEVLLADKGSSVQSVAFGTQAKGTMQRWAPKSAVAFVALTDAPFNGTVLTLQSLVKPPEGTSAYDVVTVHCYDREGKPVASPDLRLE